MKIILSVIAILALGTVFTLPTSIKQEKTLSLSSLLPTSTGSSNTNILSTLAHLTQGTDLATVLNILNFLNSVHALTNDIHSIPAILNQTIAALGEGVANATLAILNELSGKRSLDLSSLLPSSSGTNILSTLAHLTQGTDLATVLNILNFLNSIHALSNDIHSIPAILNQTVAALGQGVADATLSILNELSGRKRGLDLSSLLPSSSGTNILSTLAHLTQGTDLATVLNILNFLNSIHALSNDIHSIPAILNQTVAALGQGVADATLAILNELSGRKRSLDLSSLLPSSSGTNILSTLAHLTQGTDLATVLNILNFLTSIHALTNDIHSIPAILNQTVAALGQGVANATLAILNELSG